MRGKVGVCLAAAVLLATSGLPQTQPNRAVNRQDEVVDIPAPAPGADGTLKIFRTGDKQEMHNYISQVVQLQNTDAIEILPYVRSAVALEKGFARVLKNISAGTEYLQIITTEEQMPSIVATIQALDQEGAISHPGEKRIAVRMRYRLASEVADIIRQTTMQPEGRVIPDDITNTIYIADSFSDVSQHDMIRDFYDVPAPQVEFDVQIIDVREKDLGPDKIGLDWDAFKRSYSGSINGTFNLFEGGKRFGRIDGLLGLDARVLMDFLNFVVQEGHGEIIQRAKVTGNNLTPAVVRSIQRVPYIDYVRTDRAVAVVTEQNPRANGATEGRPGDDDYPLNDPRIVTITPSPHFERADLGEDEEGIMVVIRPVIGTRLVTADMSVEAQTVIGYDQLDRPIVATRDLESALTLEDGKTLRAGVIERDIATEYQRKIPWLSKIPIIRSFTRMEAPRVEKSHMFIFITPDFSNMYRYDAEDLSTSPPDGYKGDLLVLQDPKYPDEQMNQLLPPE